MKPISLAVTGAAAMAAALSFNTGARAAYPEKPINFIVPFGAGSSFGALARKIGQYWEKDLKVSIVVQPLPGSGGRRGGIRINKSKPDGYTIGWTHFVPFLSDVYLRGKKAAVDITKVPIIYQVAASQFYLIVPKKSPYKSVADMKKAGKSFKFSSTGVGAITWVQASALGATAGFPVNYVLGYKKLGDAALAVAKGDAEAGIGGIVHFRSVRDDVRPIFFFGPKRDKFFPDVPSAGELGYDQLTNLGAPRVITAPPGTPKAYVERLREATKKVMADAAFQEWASKTGFYLNPQGPQGTWKGLNDKIEIFKKLRPIVEAATTKKTKK